MQSKSFKSDRHLQLAYEDRATAQADSARAIARAFNRPPITRSHRRPNTLVRVLRAVWLAL